MCVSPACEVHVTRMCCLKVNCSGKIICAHKLVLIIRNLAGQSYTLYQLFSDNIFGLQGYNNSFVLSLVAMLRCCIAADCDGAGNLPKDAVIRK